MPLRPVFLSPFPHVLPEPNRSALPRLAAGPSHRLTASDLLLLPNLPPNMITPRYPIGLGRLFEMIAATIRLPSQKRWYLTNPFF